MIFSAEYLIAQPEPQLTTNDGCWLSIPFLSFSCEEEIDLSLIDRLAFSLLSFMLFPLQLERPLYFDPFGQTGFAHFGHNIIAPCKVLVQGSILFYPFRDSGFS